MSVLDDRLLELALQTSAEPMLILAGDLTIAWANLAACEDPDRVRGRSLDDFLSRVQPAAEFYQPEISEQLNRKLAMLPFGEVRWRHAQLAPGAGGGAVLLIRWHLLAELPDRYILINLQNHARRRSDPGPAEQALKSQQIFMNQLIHELRTPLAIAVGSLRRAGLQVQSSPEAAEEYFQMAAQELRRMQRLIDHLTVLTDIDAGSQRWKARPVLVHQLLLDWYLQLPDALSKNLAILLADDVVRQHISVDLEGLTLVLNNLVDNAVRYGGADSIVVLYVVAHDGLLKLYVADWGQGIPADLQEVVFDRFRRLEQHRDPSRADGAGLGLAVCRAMLAMMNGQISILPRAEACSPIHTQAPRTVIKVRLPLLGVRAEHELAVLDPAIATTNGRQLEASEGLLAYLSAVRELED